MVHKKVPDILMNVVQSIAKGVFLVWFTLTLVFFVLLWVKGNPVSLYMDPRLSSELRDSLSEKYGFEGSAVSQYHHFVLNMARGSFGVSFVHKRKVSDLIGAHLKNSIWMGGYALFFGFTWTLVTLWGQSRSKSAVVRFFFRAQTSLFLGVPSFLLGILLLQVFGFIFPLFPAFGSVSLFTETQSVFEHFLDKLQHLILPGTCLGLALSARLSAFLSQELDGLEYEPYILSARGRGVSEKNIFWKHKMLALVPTTIQLLGLYLPVLVSGALVLEHLFGWAGMGTLVFDAVVARDYPVLLASTLVISSMVILGYQLSEFYRNNLLAMKHNQQKGSSS